MGKVNFIPIAKPYIDEKEIHAVSKVIKSGMLAQGKQVELLEKKFCKASKSKYAVAVSSGTTALHTALFSAGIEDGDEVITATFSFIATANSIRMLGATPVFVDIKEDFNIDPDKIENAITKKTKAILTVDLFGNLCDYSKIRKIAKKYNLIVVSDSAQSIGAKINGRSIGELVDIACFSLYATKNITSGEGGVIVMNNKIIYERAIQFRQHGQETTGTYKYSMLGYNYRMTDINASIALAQMTKLKEIVKKRNEIAKIYLKELYGIENIILPSINNNSRSVYNQFTIRVIPKAKKTRNELQGYMLKNKIQLKIYYPKPLHKIPHLIKVSRFTKFENAEQFSKEVISLPIYPGIKREEIYKITEYIKKFYEK